MILSTRGRYAVMAMVELATRESDAPISLQNISESQEIPLAYLEQIFAKLRRGGIVKSVRGKNGGYILANNSDSITISDIVLSADEPLKITRCGDNNLSDKGCMPNNSRCLTHDLWEGLSKNILQYLSAITLDDLCQNRIAEKFPELFTIDFIGNE